jgi:hypothetical protein
MSFTIEDTVFTCHLLPQDGPEAKDMFLNHLMNPGETWIIAYGFTMEQVVQDLIAAHRADVPLHLYLDHSQAGGKTEEPVVQALVDAGVEVTIGTSPAGSRFICHTKGVVVAEDPAAWCWEGSVNFSQDGWFQVNTALVFNSNAWRDQFVAQFNALRAFAWKFERDLQKMPAPPPQAGPSVPPQATT